MGTVIGMSIDAVVIISLLGYIAGKLDHICKKLNEKD